ncbi:MAG TPA: bifunctional DNA-binding transcriptional regulator/O6-methylguanine-DNA methyltransferase Ada [Acidobacteriaceae bacterium]|nr:bifunctional DNA-binding transcriptional regulator/O6-methylguanine-DNA methyltransferase Ada [Acidobacteriaceae bacterium]
MKQRKQKFNRKKRSVPPGPHARRLSPEKEKDMTGEHIWDRVWEMVVERKHSADALFVYAVRTTGIYCRPSCPSRRPLRTSVEFYPTSELAERAGYRACKRCTPAQEHPQLRILTAACDYLSQNGDQPVKLQELGKAIGLSPFHTQRIFRRCLGITPLQYQQVRRMEHFRKQLSDGDSVTAAIYDSGFGSSSRLYEHAKEHLGMTPAELRHGGKDVEIRYSISNSPLDKMLVAVTDVGLCAVSFGSLESELEDDLASRFALSHIRRDEQGLGSLVQQVLTQMTEHPVALALPLDIRATAFQHRVWQALRQIPRGETRSYAQVAAAIGQPKAVRAVARACAQNPVAIVVPCHRVVGSNGKLTGYHWGLSRKEKILEMESASRSL